MLNNQHSQPLRCHTNESPDMPVRFIPCSFVGRGDRELV